jgi:hypothetical protein
MSFIFSNKVQEPNMGSIKKPLFNIIGILCLAITVATMGPNGRIAEAESVFDPAGFENTAVPAPIGPGLESSTAFHFLQPIAAPSGDPSKFDPDLLPYLTVDVCAVTTIGCDPIVKFTSPQIRIATTGGYGSFYIVNWDTNKSNFSSKKTYRVSVSLIDEVLGSVDLTPSMYSSFGRTWPIKFMIEKDPRLRIKILAFAGKNLWQVADDLRTELGICGDALKQLLLDNYPNADPEQVDEVVNGVCQEVELFPTTKIADKVTRDALAFYDTSTGRMVFAGDTNILKNLKVNDVLAGREGPTAPYGYLRTVTSIRKNKGVYTLETVQAKFTEAIKRATIQTSGPLEPADQTQTFAPEGRSAEFDVGKSIPFKQHIDVVIDLNGGDDELGGSGTINVVGDVEIQAGYNIGAGIELCKTPPFACADRVEAWMGFVQKSSLHVTGKFDGHLHKEYAYPIEMSPIFFMIGPIPVWLVPEINVVVGLDGRAHVDFEFNAAAQSTVKPYIKWTEDEGWKDLTAFAPLSHSHADVKFAGNAELEGYAKLDAALLLYGVIGPSMDGSLGIVGKAQTGQSPFWEIHGHVKAGIGLKSAFMDLFDVDAHDDLFEDTFDIAESGNLPPECNWSSDTISAEIGQVKVLGPRSGFEGYFECTDLEGDIPTYTALSRNTNDGTNGVIPLSYAFQSSGLRTVTVTASDSDGGHFSFPLKIDVHNSLPVVNVFAGDTAEATVKFSMSAEAFDPDTSAFLPCSRIDWAAPPDTVTELNGGCSAEVKFAQPGIHTVTVTATDFFGGVGTKSISVNVLPAPSNLPPDIDALSLEIHAASARGGGPCFSGNSFCLVPASDSAQFLWSGFGQQQNDEYEVPLTLWVDATDPEGDAINYVWHCKAGNQDVIATSLGDDVYQCTPPFVQGVVIQVYAVVSDGILRPNNTTIPRTFFYRQTPN